MTDVATQTFTQFMAERVGARWMIARKTKRLIAHYPEYNILTQAQFSALYDEWRASQTTINALTRATPDLLVAREACLLREDIASDALGDMLRAAVDKASRGQA